MPSAYGIAGGACPHCGATTEAGAQFCVACGTYFGTGARVDVAGQGKESKRKADGRRMYLIIGAAAAGVVIIAAVAFGLRSLRGARSERPRPSQQLGAPPLERGEDEGYLETVVYAPGRVRAKMDTMAANQAVKAFQATKGRLPDDIAELEAAGYKLPPLSAGLEYEYDSESGEISVWRIKDRDGPASGD